MLLGLDDYTLLMLISYIDKIKDYRSLLCVCKRLYHLTSNCLSTQKLHKEFRKTFKDEILTTSKSNILTFQYFNIILKYVCHILTIRQCEFSTIEKELLSIAAPHSGKNMTFLLQNGFNVNSFKFYYHFKIEKHNNVMLCSIDYKSRITGKISEAVVAIMFDEGSSSEEFFFYNTAESNKLKSTPVIKPPYKDDVYSSFVYSSDEDILKPVCIELQKSLGDNTKITPRILCEFMKKTKSGGTVQEQSTILQETMEKSSLQNLDKLELPFFHKTFLDNLKTISAQLKDPTIFFEDLIKEINPMNNLDLMLGPSNS